MTTSGEETADLSASDPTILEGHTLGASQLDRELIDEAIRQGLITEVQGTMVLESLSGNAELASTPGATVSLLVERGLVPQDKADELLDSLSEDFVPGFRLGRELGRGAMGVVYEAKQKRLDRRVALKVVNPSLSADAGYVKRFKREALTLAKLNHPNIVQVYDYGDVNGRIYLALEFVEGEDVSEMQAREGPLSELIALKIARDAALGLSHAHQHGVIHRDIKPANLLLRQAAQDASGEDFTTKVTDLGLAREAESQGDGELTAAGTILGTPAYMAPEQTQGKPADYRCDIYALGASVYHMVTGDVPYQDSSVVNMLIKKRTERLPNPQDRAPNLSSGLVRLLDRMLAREPDMRYQDYQDLITDIDRLILGEEPLTPPVDEDQSSLALHGLVESYVAKDQTVLAKARAASARLGRAVSGAPEMQASAEGKGASFVPLLMVVGLLAAIGYAVATKGSQPKPTPAPSVASKTGAPTPTPGASDPNTAGDKITNGLKAVQGLSARDRLRQVAVLQALSDDIERAPEAERPAFRLRLGGIVGAALDEAGSLEIEAASKIWRQGDYAGLAARVERLNKAYALAKRDRPTKLTTLERRAQDAAKKGAGAKERELWKIATTESADPFERLQALQTLQDNYATFSPVIERARKLDAELSAAHPVLVVIPTPTDATVFVDGKEIGKGRSEARYPAGQRTLKVTAEGYRDYTRSFDHRARQAETVELAPLSTKKLKRDSDFFTIRNTAEAREALGRRWSFAGRGGFTKAWDYDGEWRREQTLAGVSGNGLPDDYRTATRRDLPKAMRFFWSKGLAGWEITLRMLVFAGVDPNDPLKMLPVGSEALARTAAEVRVLNAGGRWVVVGFDKGLIYAGLRGPKGLLVKRTEAIPPGEAPPSKYRLRWDGDVVEIYVGKAKAQAKFFHAMRLPGTPEQALSLAVKGGSVIFKDLELNALVADE